MRIECRKLETRRVGRNERRTGQTGGRENPGVPGGLDGEMYKKEKRKKGTKKKEEKGPKNKKKKETKSFGRARKKPIVWTGGRGGRRRRRRGKGGEVEVGRGGGVGWCC